MAPLQQIVVMIIGSSFITALLGFAIYALFFSESANAEAERARALSELPPEVTKANPLSCHLGWDTELKGDIFFPDAVRSRHVHILGATGSGKTDSVLLRLIDQDVSRGYPVVILDAKGDAAFANFLKEHPRAVKNLLVVDPGNSKESVRYNPLESGSITEATARLFNSMVWSEEFYKTKSREMLMKVAGAAEKKKKKLTLFLLKEIFESTAKLSAFIGSEDDPFEVSEKEYEQISGLIAQINQLCHGELGEVIGGREEKENEDEEKKEKS